MLTVVFYWLVNMSITAAVSGAVVLLLRLIKKIPRRVICRLWVIPFIRMWLPFGLGSKYSLMSFLSRHAFKTVVVYTPSKILSGMNSMGLAESYQPFTLKSFLLERVFGVASVIWAVAALALILAFVFLYVITLRELSDAEPLYDNLYVSYKITSPAVYGIFRPKIIIPWAYRDSDLTFVLMHEREHIKHADNLLRFIAFMTAALHWFDPFAWVFLKCFLTDLELACDERVLKKCGEEQKKEYARALLGFAESKSVFTSAFGGAKIRTRIENILSYRRMTVFSALCFALLAALTAYVLLTNAV